MVYAIEVKDEAVDNLDGFQKVLLHAIVMVKMYEMAGFVLAKTNVVPPGEILWYDGAEDGCPVFFDDVFG